MDKRFPVTARGTEAALASVLRAAFDLNRWELSLGPPAAADQAWVSAVAGL